jgi:hypothetical protein
MPNDLLSRIEQRLEAVNLSATAASRKAGLSVDAIRNLQRARANGVEKGLSTRTLTALAETLMTTPGWLLEGEGDPETAKPPTVPVVGYVQAGAEAVLFASGQGPFDYVPAPEGSSRHTVAAEIRGESLGPFFSEWLIFWDDVRSPITEDLIGSLCVVGLPDGRILVKKLKSSKVAGLYHLLSQTEAPIFDQEIEWAAKVTNMSPR